MVGACVCGGVRPEACTVFPKRALSPFLCPGGVVSSAGGTSSLMGSSAPTAQTPAIGWREMVMEGQPVAKGRSGTLVGAKWSWGRGRGGAVIGAGWSRGSLSRGAGAGPWSGPYSGCYASLSCCCAGGWPGSSCPGGSPPRLWPHSQSSSGDGRPSPSFGKLCSERRSIVVRCSDACAGGHGTPAGFRMYPPLPLKRARCSCTGRSFVVRLSAA